MSSSLSFKQALAFCAASFTAFLYFSLALICSDVNKTKFLRPRPRPEQQDQDQDQSLQDQVQDQDQDQSDKTKTKTGLKHHGCSYTTRTAHHQNSFLSVYLKDCCT